MKASIASLLAASAVDRLDAEVLLAHALQVGRTYLYAHNDEEVDGSQFQVLLKRRRQGEPIAYIVGEKEFWGLSFKVTPATLIPRPETELLIEETLKQLHGQQKIRIADLGTGSGAIALSLAHEQPTWKIDAVDISSEALMVAKENQQQLKITNVNFHQGSWCEMLPSRKYQAIVANPPYIAKTDQHLGEGDVRFEPQTALIAEDDGLSDIKVIINQAKYYLVDGGFLLFEHGYDQAEPVSRLLAQAGYQNICCLQDLAGLDRAHFAYNAPA